MKPEYSAIKEKKCFMSYLLVVYLLLNRKKQDEYSLIELIP